MLFAGSKNKPSRDRLHGVISQKKELFNINYLLLLLGYEENAIQSFVIAMI
jgi:hypothetical protein